MQNNIDHTNNMKKKAAKPAMRPMSSHPSNLRAHQQPKENTLNIASKDVIETDEIKKKNDLLEK